MDEIVTVGSPLYVVLSSMPCWKCKADHLVIALASNDVGSDKGDGPYLLSNIAAMPSEIQAHLAAFHPPFQMRRSKTIMSDYFANTCSACGVNFGDFFLFSEPEGAFFPMDEEQAKAMSIIELPFTGQFEFRCHWSAGSGKFIFAHADRLVAS